MLSPADENELVEAVASAKSPLKIQGGGTRPIGHDVEGETISTAKMSGITLYEPGALTLVAKAGTPVDEIENSLDAEGQMLAFEPMDHRAIFGIDQTPTIGGVVAGNVSGSRRVQAGACRDFLLGVRFVDGMGNLVKNGGRVMKNVTGYDLTKFLAGSRGTLGVLSEVSLKVLPKPEATKTVVLRGLSVDDAVEAMSLAMTSPFEITGAAYLPAFDEGGSVTVLRIEGFEDSVAYRTGKLSELLKRHGQEGDAQDAPTWAWIRDAEMFRGSESDLWRISIKPTDAPTVAERLGGADLLLDWAGGLIWAGTAPGFDVRSQLAGIPGHATLIRASDETKRTLGVFHPEPDALTALAHSIRQKFDPKGILNPGLMG